MFWRYPQSLRFLLLLLFFFFFFFAVGGYVKKTICCQVSMNLHIPNNNDHFAVR